jgi:hypothetical protein
MEIGMWLCEGARLGASGALALLLGSEEKDNT